MMRSFLAAVFLFGFAGIACVESKEAQVAVINANIDMREAKYAAMETDVLSLINKYRKTKGLSQLTPNDVAAEEARKHSENMAKGKVPFSHEGFNTRSKTIVSKVPGVKGVAENVAFGQRSAQEVVNDWIKSPGHKHNIEGNYSQSGIGIVADAQGVLYYTQMFVK